ncbi:GlsB/YeaQ/YmgE family stress response membrane protein [Solimonas terrae]|uniref:GlsB/YeaQ/YmgE family stress response membrane protein n=1 Tax=Solimonas terrae TaxID=1396819 RepID=A0A6M2BRK1_9GAMM|nr:GlsB/YeaQ/YmgE family stress response membrane protein [Solimonas terrae]NGY04649.1 GlsB/YeaQ/YmgE family stress response membrane protein [Solimonas terrae]
MNIVVWILVGGICGWLVSLLVATDARQGWMENVAIGIVGAFVGGYLVGPLASGGAIDQLKLSPSSLTVALIGAVTVLSIARLLRHVTAQD